MADRSGMRTARRVLLVDFINGQMRWINEPVWTVRDLLKKPKDNDGKR